MRADATPWRSRRGRRQRLCCLWCVGVVSCTFVLAVRALIAARASLYPDRCASCARTISCCFVGGRCPDGFGVIPGCLEQMYRPAQRARPPRIQRWLWRQAEASRRRDTWMEAEMSSPQWATCLLLRLNVVVVERSAGLVCRVGVWSASRVDVVWSAGLMCRVDVWSASLVVVGRCEDS